MNNMWNKWRKEKDGGVLEYLILISVVAVIAATYFPDLRSETSCIYENAASNINLALGEESEGGNEECGGVSDEEEELIEDGDPVTPPPAEEEPPPPPVDPSTNATIVLPTERDASNCYIVKTIGELQAMEQDLIGCYVLDNDINAGVTAGWNNGEGFKPIGGANGERFKGKLDGKGFAVNGLTINRPSRPNVGLIGESFNAVVENIELSNVDVSGGEFNVGAVIALGDGTIRQVDVSGKVTANGGQGVRVGGVSGDFGGTMENTHSRATVEGSGGTGGLVGNFLGYAIRSSSFNGIVQTPLTHGINMQSKGIGGIAGQLDGVNSTVIEYSYHSGEVRTANGFAGGIVGVLTKGKVLNSYSSGKVSCINTCSLGGVGGVVGEMKGGTLKTSYASGLLTLSPSAGGQGGAVGRRTAGTVTDVFWDLNATGKDTSAGGSGKTTAEMKTQSTFTGWTFANSGIGWKIDSSVNSGYPHLVNNLP